MKYIDWISFEEWQSHKKDYVVFHNENRQKVSAHIIWPNREKTDYSTPRPWVIGIHGATSSKHEWTELNGYTKGGDLTLKLLERGVVVVAVDLHFHGENNNIEGLDFNESSIFPTFVKNSIEDLKLAVELSRQNVALDNQNLNFMGYSMGGLFALQLLKSGLSFNSMALMVPGIMYSNKSEFAPHRHINAFESNEEMSLIQISATSDEYVLFEDAQKFMLDIPLKNKTFLSADSGHSLPIDYIDPLIDWFELNQ
jgi:dienelactone hydrolase